jgi:hypothetical protein
MNERELHPVEQWQDFGYAYWDTQAGHQCWKHLPYNQANHLSFVISNL